MAESSPIAPGRAMLLSEIFPPKVGGSGRWFWEVYRRLPRDRVLIAAGDDELASDFDARHEVEIERIPLTFPSRFVRPISFGSYRTAYRCLLRLARLRGVQTIHCGRPVPEGLLGLWLKWRTGIGYACYSHGEDVNLSNAEQVPAWHRRAVYSSRELGQLVGLVLRGADFVVANSQNTSDILTGRWKLPAEKVRVLHPGVDASEFVPAARDASVRRRLGWREGPVVLTVGRLQRRKGQDMMIRALGAIGAELPNLLYAIVGDGEDLERLRALARDEGVEDQVLFMGALSDEELVECYQQCDLFVLPNREIEGDIEGFGMVLLEAQACGRPVVAGASGGTAETMREGKTGFVIPCDEPTALAELVVDLIKEPERLDTLGAEARRWVETRFDWTAVSSKASELFQL